MKTTADRSGDRKRTDSGKKKVRGKGNQKGLRSGGRKAAAVKNVRKKNSSRAVSAQRMFAQNSRGNRLSMILAVAVVAILMVAVGVNAISLRRHLRENQARAEELRAEIREETRRKGDIEEYRHYTETDAYIEEVAREKLGLIYEGETVFKEEK
ncbi:MAG: septum formation initiator family protein [Eubacteriales bacterium]|nr:septum formation initiator family protein [Eubacteriales bacterium]